MNSFYSTNPDGSVRPLSELAEFCRARIAEAEAAGVEITDGTVVDLIADNSDCPLDTIRDALVAAGLAERFPRATAKHYGAAKADFEGIKWTSLRYPCGDPENGPARRNPVDGCVKCEDKEAESYNDSGECLICTVGEAYVALREHVQEGGTLEFGIEHYASLFNVPEDALRHEWNLMSDLREAPKASPDIGEVVETIDLTPSWREAATVLLAVLENGTAEGKRLAREEILRMTDVLDALIAERGHKGPVSNSALRLRYEVNHSGERDAGIHPYSEGVTVIVDSGDVPEADEFASQLRDFFAEWYEGAGVDLVERKPS